MSVRIEGPSRQISGGKDPVPRVTGVKVLEGVGQTDGNVDRIKPDDLLLGTLSNHQDVLDAIGVPHSFCRGQGTRVTTDDAPRVGAEGIQVEAQFHLDRLGRSGVFNGELGHERSLFVERASPTSAGSPGLYHRINCSIKARV